MLFIFLFAICGLAIPIALEVHVRGDNNILTRAGLELAHTTMGRRVGRIPGAAAEWANSLVALALLFLAAMALLFILGWGALSVLSWLLRLLF